MALLVLKGGLECSLDAADLSPDDVKAAVKLTAKSLTLGAICLSSSVQDPCSLGDTEAQHMSFPSALRPSVQ